MYELVKILNNNAILVRHPDTLRESILMGKGLGFHREIDMNEVSKVFHIQDSEEKQNYLHLFESVDPEVLNAVSEIVGMAKEHLGSLHPSLFIVLSGHLDFAVKRFREGHNLDNRLLWEISQLYPQEFAVAMEARRLLNQRFNIFIDANEVGFLALHLNAGRLHQTVKEALRRTNLIQSLLLLVKEKSPQEHWDYVKVQHIDYFKDLFYRLDGGIVLRNPLLPYLHQLKEEEHLARILAEKIPMETNFNLSEAEIGYLAIHLNQFRNMA